MERPFGEKAREFWTPILQGHRKATPKWVSTFTSMRISHENSYFETFEVLLISHPDVLSKLENEIFSRRASPISGLRVIALWGFRPAELRNSEKVA